MSYQADPQQNITAEYRLGYSKSIDRITQQENQKFLGMGVLEPRWTTNQFVFTDRSKVEMVTNNARFGQTNAVEATYGNRSGFKTKFQYQEKFDKWDDELAGELGNPVSAAMVEVQSALNRKLDDIFVSALFADAITGDFPHNASTVSFPAGNIIAVNYDPQGIDEGGSIGMTIGKLVEAKRLLLTAEIPASEPIMAAISPTQWANLMNYSQVYKNSKWAETVAEWASDPENRMLLGMKVVQSNRLPITSDGTNVRSCAVWAKRAMGLAPVSAKKHLDILPTHNHNVLMAQYYMAGAVRKRDELVYKVLCDEDSTAGTATTF